MSAVSFGQCLTHRIISSAGDTFIQVSLGSVFYPKRYELMSIGTGNLIGGVAGNYFSDSFLDSTETCRVHTDTYGEYIEGARVVIVVVASIFTSCAIFWAFSMNNPAVSVSTFLGKKWVVTLFSLLPHWLPAVQWTAMILTLLMARYCFVPYGGANRA